MEKDEASLDYASLLDAVDFIGTHAWWWYELPPGVRAFYRLKARLMSSRLTPYLAILVIAAVLVLSFLLDLPVGAALVILGAGVLLGFLINWAIHNGDSSGKS